MISIRYHLYLSSWEKYMGYKLAIDFGTTNSVIACWNDEKDDAEVIAIPPITDMTVSERPPIVPSLIYVDDAKAGKFTIGQTVREQNKDGQKDNRLFRNFKRGIVATPAPEPREIDGQLFADRNAGAAFVKQVIESLPHADKEIEQLVLTAPVAAFEGYLSWLNQVIDDIAPEKIRVVDESTAAALGYAVTEPGAVVLVFDFGGGTLDLSLVQLPEHQRKTGGFLKSLLGNREAAAKNAARVIAKAGRIIGGSDIDQWLLQEVLKKTGVSSTDLGSNYAPLLTECERAKIELSNEESVEIKFEAAGKPYNFKYSREELEKLLEENEFYTALRRVVDKVMHVARQRGIFKEDIKYVLMVGGTSLMPSVQKTLAQYFTDMAVRADKPFTAVAEGALQLAAGYGLEDYLVHSYGLRYLDDDNQHAWDEIIPMGSGYPITKPIEVMLSAAHDDQESIEIVIGEIETDAVSMIEVKYEDGQAVFVADTKEHEQRIMPMNEADALKMLAKLEPKGQPGEARIKAYFTVDERRQLRMTIFDMLKNKVLLENVAVVTLQ
jgi:molecular chaperone DnaK (HSP70)